MNDSEIISEKLENELKQLVQKNSIIPKPHTNNPFRVLRIGRRRNQTAIIYSIPCHTGKKSHYEKGVTYSDFAKVLQGLEKNGFVTLSWFAENLPDCVKEGSCNYTSLCGMLELLGYCKYSPSERCYIKCREEHKIDEKKIVD